jgi:hypothetical protein
MKKIISLLLIMALCLVEIPAVKVNAKDKQFNENLTAGEYLVGEDIPVGKYDIKATAGCGVVNIYKNQNNYDKGDSPFKSICIGTEEEIKGFESMYGSSYKNLRLKKNYYMVIGDALEINFKSK